MIAVTGTRREGAVLRGDGVRVICGGNDPARLARELDGAAANAAGIVSFGMAGALDPALAPGDWVIGDRLAGGGGECSCDPAWVEALAKCMPAARIGPAWCDGKLVSTPAEKQALHALSGALTADMESHIAAGVAQRSGLPFAILRCVSDAADAALPPAIAVAMRPDGGLALGAVLGSVLAQPWQLPGLVSTAARFARAYRSLKAGTREVGPRLAFDLR